MGPGTDNNHLAVERPMPLRVASTEGLDRTSALRSGSVEPVQRDPAPSLII